MHPVHVRRYILVIITGKKPSHEIDMDPAQVQAMENLRRVQKTQSRVSEHWWLIS